MFIYLCRFKISYIELWVSIPSKVAQCFFYYSLFRFGFVHLPCILSFSCIVVMLYIIIVNILTYIPVCTLCVRLKISYMYMYGAIESSDVIFNQSKKLMLIKWTFQHVLSSLGVKLKISYI